ncbi:MAG: helix-turn-helix domain-containing protein [bacterium]
MTDESLTISQASEETGLPESTIRFYDREFSEYLTIERGDNNQRLFSEQDLEDLQYIRYLTKREDLSVEEVKNRLKQDQKFQERNSGSAESDNYENNSNGNAESPPQEVLDRLEALEENREKVLERIDQLHEELQSIQDSQEQLRELLDMNIKRYNQLVDQM